LKNPAKYISLTATVCPSFADDLAKSRGTLIKRDVTSREKSKRLNLEPAC